MCWCTTFIEHREYYFERVVSSGIPTQTTQCSLSVTSRNFPYPSDTLLAPYDQTPNPEPWTLP
ncbi:hypothetical protein BS17DRAFT_780893, partial [Gyrodon lividus]